MSKLTFSILLLWLITLLAGCGGGTTDTSGPGTGTLGILVTDNPITDGTIKAVCVTYNKVEVLGDGRYPVYQGEPRTFNLLNLRDHSRPIAFHEVPAGVYDKIRMTLEDDGIELKLDDTDCHTASRNSAYPKLPGNNKLDFVVKGGLVIAPDAVVVFEFDMDAEKAIHVVERGGQCDVSMPTAMDLKDVDESCLQFNFRSVVFVRAITRDYTGKLVRLVGYIREVEPEDRSLLLCDALPGMEEMDDEDATRCIRVRVSRDDSFFDKDGFPQPLRALQRTEGMQATVNGKLWHVIKPEIPDDHYPPPGECRVWDSTLPDGQQSPPGDCEDLWEHDDDDDKHLIHHDEDEYRYPLVVDALTIGLGETLVVEGEVVTAPVEVPNSTDDEFTMDVNRPDPLAVRLQAAVEGGNGTRIVDQRGKPVTSDALFPPRPVRVDGVYDSDEVLMRGGLVVLLDQDALGLIGTTRLSGIIATDSVETGGTGFVLILDTNDPDNANAVPSGSDQRVTVPAEARILLVNTVDSTTRALTQEQLERAEGQYINLYAVKPTDGLGEWIADTIVVITPTP